ncbi:MAG TPA: DegT/DnrJ/EryC1/StrS family aminotransferase [Gemmatimonadaceae bacterium]|nr:DegT/DnrJ/EryC1/StrS family aminotransferase [Gemmatimonadaceae bacterium]
MIGRRQLPVASPISVLALARSLVESSRAPVAIQTRARERIIRELGVRTAALTDSGTSALVLAFRLAAPGGVVGLPAYACVDLTAAALYAGVRVRLYDIDPETLSPDLDSVRDMLRRGVDAIVVAHLFGYPADVPSVRDLVAREGVTLIEDAAQGAGGTLNGHRLGSLGDLGVLSFGRGKGLCAGGGGALLGAGERWVAAVDAIALETPGRGLSALSKTAIQWALGRPAVYALPAMLPWLHLGEMVYHPAHEPQRMSVASSSLVESAFDLEPADLRARREHAGAIDQMVRGVPKLAAAPALTGASPGFLRFALRDVSGRRAPVPALGIVRPYPATLAEHAELRPILIDGEPAVPGSATLRDSLLTLPTHRFVSDADLSALQRWVRDDDGSDRG